MVYLIAIDELSRIAFVFGINDIQELGRKNVKEVFENFGSDQLKIS